MEFRVICIALISILCFGRPSDGSAADEEETPPQLPTPAARKSNNLRPPRITEHPTSILSMPSDSNLRLDCGVDGNPMPSITWLKDGASLAKASVRDLIDLGNSLLFIHVRSKGKEHNTGTYQCIASNTLGTVGSNNATVQVASIRHDFRQEPADTIAILGEQAIIECIGPKGVPEPDITWKKDERTLQLDRRIQIRKGNLVISRTRKNDAGSYACVASNGAGQRVSNAAILRVDQLPELTIQPKDQETLVDKTLELKCQATGDPPPRISWTKDGQNMDYDSRTLQLSNGNIRISPVRADDDGEYTCMAKNRAGKIASSALVSVKGPPEFTEVSTDKVAEVGSTVTLKCRVSGNPPPTIFWRDLSGNGIFTGTPRADDHIVVTENGDLVIYSLKFQDDGMYQCEAHSGVGDISRYVRLTVQPRISGQPPPVIERGPANSTVSEGSKVSLHCSSLSAPEPRIVWYKDDQPVDTASSRSRLEQTASGSLQIRDIERKDSGRYTCKVINDYGVATWDAWLSVSRLPGISPTVPNADKLPHAPEPPRLMNSTSNSISIAWDESLYQGASPVEYYLIDYYRIRSASTWKRLPKVTGTVCDVFNLKASSEYVFLIRAVNKQGVSNPSPISEKIGTKRLGDPSTSTTLNSMQKFLDKIEIRLTQAVPLTPQGSRVGAVRIMWATTSGCDDMDSFVVAMQPVTGPEGKYSTVNPSCSARTYDLTNIAAGVTYEVRIRPRKGSFKGQPSAIAFVSLGSGRMESQAPTLVARAGEQSTNSIAFSWAPPSDLSSNRITGYSLRCRSEDDSFDKTFNLNGSQTELVLQNLSDETKYTATVTYATILGAGTTSETASVDLGVAGTTVSNNNGGFMETIQNQPAVIAGLAAGVLLLIGIVAGVWYYRRRKRDRKARSLHGPNRINSASRFGNTVAYTPSFEIKPTVGDASPSGSSLNGGGVGGGLGSNGAAVGGLGSSDNSRMFMQRPPLNNPSGVRQNTVVTYDAKNGSIDEKPTGVAHPTFSYVTDQLTSVSDIPPQFATANHSRPSHALMQPLQVQQQIQQHHDQLQRHRSGSSNVFTNSIVAESDSRYPDTSTTPSNVHIVGDLPPPPPSPPLSHKTSISDRTNRSRGSSAGMHSSAERSSRGQRSRRRAQMNPANHVANAQMAATARYASIDDDTEIDSPYASPSPHRLPDTRGIPSPTPPTPPIRDASAYSYGQGQPVMRFDDNQNSTFNLALMVEPSKGDVPADNDRIAKLRTQQFVNDSSQRNSVAVSAVSMMNTYGSETDEREDSSSGRHSPSSSDDESFHLESASQVGQSLLGHEEDEPVRPNPQPRFYKPSPQDVSPRRQYSYHNTSEEHALLASHQPAQGLPPAVKPRPTRKTASKGRRSAKKSSESNLSRMTSGSSSASSSYHHNTGDSGMSAGVGCSTEHSSLNSNASAGSGTGVVKASRSWTSGNLSSDIPVPDAQIRPPGSVSLKRLITQNSQEGYSNPVSPAASVVSEHSGYQSTASSCWQYHEPYSKPASQTPRRPPRVGNVVNDSSVESQRPSNFPGSKELRQDLSELYSNSADQTPVFTDFNPTPTNADIIDVALQFQATRPVFDASLTAKLGNGKAQDLSDVPEMSTSDFCEDYSDQSQ